MNGQLDLRVSEADLLTAYRAHYPLFPGSKVALGALILLLLVASFALWDSPPDARHIALLAGGLLFSLVFMLVAIQLVMRRWWLPRYTRRIHSQQADLRTSWALSWDEEKLSIANPDNSGNVAWGDFHQWLRTRGMLLIYRSEALFNIIPLHDAAAERAADAITALLQQAGVPQKRSS